MAKTDEATTDNEETLSSTIESIDAQGNVQELAFEKPVRAHRIEYKGRQSFHIYTHDDGSETSIEGAPRKSFSDKVIMFAIFILLLFSAFYCWVKFIVPEIL